MNLLENVEEVTQRCDHRNVEVPEDLKEHTHTRHDHCLPDERVFLHYCLLLLAQPTTIVSISVLTGADCP